MNYPGDSAEPKAVARWMAWVAENTYGLPGILPVMTSCVELTQAWTGPGDVKDVPGYLEARDHDSLGYFQQRPSQGWGTPEQLIDADYALRAFCREAVKFKGQYREADPEELSAWCQSIQRSNYPDAYVSKGYPLAKSLLEEDQVTEYPQRNIGLDGSGWALDLESNAYLRSTMKSATLYTNENGWLWGELPKTKWDWPIADDEPWASGDYQQRHPTRYTWRDDVEEWARFLVNNYDVWCNTYYDHPEGYWRTETSIDVWGPAGRNDPIDSSIGDEIFSLLFSDSGKPDIEWIIFKRTIYGAWNGWNGEPFGTDDFTWHDNHIHITYL